MTAGQTPEIGRSAARRESVVDDDAQSDWRRLFGRHDGLRIFSSATFSHQKGW